MFDHEWGHGMDDNDSGGALSNSSEGYAGHRGHLPPADLLRGLRLLPHQRPGCGKTPDGTGYNQNEAQTGAAYCDSRLLGRARRGLPGARGPDAGHAAELRLPRCSTSTGPCGRQVHCAAAPARQAAWDLVASDLQAAPFNYDSNTAFIVGNKLFYQGSGNIGAWHACNCTAGTSNGCGASQRLHAVAGRG